VREIAHLLDVSQRHLYKVMAGEMPISPDIAARIVKLVANGAGIWPRPSTDIGPLRVRSLYLLNSII
jgi:plasmid maintenance system antidote protein VapI